MAAERALDIGDLVLWRRWSAAALLAVGAYRRQVRRGTRPTLYGLGQLQNGDLAAAQAEFDRCLALAGDDDEFLDDHHWLGNVYLAQAQVNPRRSAELLCLAEDHLARARAFHEQRRAEFNTAYDELHLAQLERLRGRHDLSRRLRRRAVGVFGRDAARLQVQLQDMEDEVFAGASPAQVMRWTHSALAELSALGFAEALAGVLRLLAVAHWSNGIGEASRRRARMLISAVHLHYPAPRWELADLPEGLAGAVADVPLRHRVIDMIGAGDDIFRHLVPLDARRQQPDG